MNFFTELKRRNVFRVGIAYLLAAWVLLQIIDFVLEVIDAPTWILQVFVLAAAAGLPVVLIFSWVFEMTPEGVKRESAIDRSQSVTPQTGRKLDRVIIAFLATAVLVLLADKLLMKEVTPATDNASAQPAATAAAGPGSATDALSATATGKAATTSRKSIAVLPFLALSGGADDGYFADGLTEEILNSLAQLPELLVTARTSAFHFKGKDIPIQEIAATLGVASIVEGSVRRSGERLRVTAQLIRAEDGFHLWSENYDSTAEDTIAVQEDIAEKIAAAMNVVMNDQKREAMRQAGLRDVEAFIAWQKGLELYDRAHGDANIYRMLGEANGYFETVTQRVPGFAPAHHLQSDLYAHLLLDDAVGQSVVPLSEPERIEAQQRITQAYQAAIDVAGTPQERNNLDLDFAYLTEDWRGQGGRLERYIGEQGCSGSSWADLAGLPYGYAARLAPRLREIRQCDPLYSTRWMSEARALLWAGDAAGALQVAQEGSAIAPGAWLSGVLIRALAVQGEFETAEHEIVTRIREVADAHALRSMLAAMRGQKDEALQHFAAFEGSVDAVGLWDLTVAAWLGDRAQTNRIAGRYDQHPSGLLGLNTVVNWCMCGAPWDLAATPNFAALLQQAGFDWPPPSPQHFPLKDW